MTRVYVVTPTYNDCRTIDNTILSVMLQHGDFEIYYHVQDGGSTDGTLERLAEWQSRLQTHALPITNCGVHFSYSSGSDRSMYDAIAKAFLNVETAPDDWMTWINADDILAPGAFAVLAQIDKSESTSGRIDWLTGMAATRSADLQSSGAHRYFTRKVIASGLADGYYWPHVQQEGTFFRAKLWSDVDIEQEFASYCYAGDWNLWRIFAKRTEIYQFNYPLGFFTVRDGQLSQSEREKYDQETFRLVSPEEREKAFASIKRALLWSHIVDPDWRSGELKVCSTSAKAQYEVFRKRIRIVSQKKDAARKGSGSLVESYICREPAPSGFIGSDTTIAYDAEWQYPAITEKHAFDKAQELLFPIPNGIYFGFPWATYIDLRSAHSPRVSHLERLLATVKPILQQYRYVVTVCQHIYMLRIQRVLTDVGVNHIFWSHTVKGQPNLPDYPCVKIHSFPLFPVQCVEDKSEVSPEREHLFCFVGARADKWYLTETRNHILDYLARDERGRILARDKWHFEKAVYQHQIYRTTSDENLISTTDSEEFRKVLRSSVFSLCPSGSGPNSIRLWESIGSGTIPVVLADTYLPPGRPDLWTEATVSCSENIEEIQNLPDRLEALASDHALLERKRKALRQLWMLYGPDWFVHDIQELFLLLGSMEQPAEAPSQGPRQGVLRRLWRIFSK